MPDIPVPLGTLPDELIVRLRDRYGLRQFAETGTSSGATAVKALNYFDQVTTCEIDKARAGMLQAFMPKPPEGKKLLAVCMDSPIMLGQVFANPACLPALVWLDAHWSGGPKLGPECPLLDELRAIGGTRGRHVILIDDYRLFASSPPPPHDPAQWPAFEDIVALCGQMGPTDRVSVEGDIIIVEPGEPAT